MLNYNQIADLVNLTTRELLGEEATPINEDLSNVVDFGKQILGSNDENKWLTNFVDRIGRVLVYDRSYKAPVNLGIYKDNVEYGSVVQRYYITELPEAEINPTWELQDGQSVDQYVVHLPKATAKYYNKRSPWQITQTISDRQYRSAFTSPVELARFTASVFNMVENSRALKIYATEMAILRAHISRVVAKNIPDADYTNKSTVQAVNLRKVYNDLVEAAEQVTAAQAKRLTNKELLRRSSMLINEYIRALKDYSVLYNAEGAGRFTRAEDMKLIVLGKFADACQYYLEADTYHNNLVSLPGYDTIDCWQATGTDRSFDNLSTIHVKNDDGDEIEISGVVAVLYDRMGMGTTCENYRVTTSPYNGNGEYYNAFYKAEFAGVSFGDMNCVVFYIA